jgi:hypothetical protein
MIDDLHFQNTLSGSRPIGIRIQWKGTTGGHFVAITGISNKPNREYVVEDPDYGQLIINHSVMKSNYQSSPTKPIGWWDSSYFTT